MIWIISVYIRINQKQSERKLEANDIFKAALYLHEFFFFIL